MAQPIATDGARPRRRFWTIVFPLLAPTTFFLLVVNIVYVFFDTFGIIDAVTAGGPAGSTTTMVYKVYADGRLGGDLGGCDRVADAQGVVHLEYGLAYLDRYYRDEVIVAGLLR